MKSRLIALAVAAVVGISANADVLYWQVADNDQSKGYAAAYLMAKDADGKLYYFNENVTQSGAAVGAVGSAAPQVFANGGYAAATFNAAKLLSWDTDQAVEGLNLSTMSFYVELWNTANDFTPSSYQGRTGEVSYSQISQFVKSGFDPSFSGVNGALGSIASGVGYTNDVPEPTSGLLMLIGMGALALRRRKVA